MLGAVQQRLRIESERVAALEHALAVSQHHAAALEEQLVMQSESLLHQNSSGSSTSVSNPHSESEMMSAEKKSRNNGRVGSVIQASSLVRNSLENDRAALSANSRTLDGDLSSANALAAAQAEAAALREELQNTRREYEQNLYQLEQQLEEGKKSSGTLPSHTDSSSSSDAAQQRIRGNLDSGKLARREMEVSRREEDVEHKERELRLRERAVQEREEDVIALERDAIEKMEEYARAEQHFREREREYFDRERLLLEKEDYFRKLEQQVQDLEEEKEKLASVSSALETELEDLKKEVSARKESQGETISPEQLAETKQEMMAMLEELQALKVPKGFLALGECWRMHLDGFLNGCGGKWRRKSFFGIFFWGGFRV